MLIMIDGESGGVGKSTFTRFLLEYLINLKFSYTFYDFDRTKLDVGRVYAPESHKVAASVDKPVSESSQVEPVGSPLEDITKFDSASTEDAGSSSESISAPQKDPDPDPDLVELIRFTEDENALTRVDILFDEALDKTVVASLPSSVRVSLDRWIKMTGILDLSQKLQFDFIKFFVVTDSFESIDLFVEAVNMHRSMGIQHVLVFNTYRSENNLSQLIAKYPKLSKVLTEFENSDSLLPIEKISLPTVLKDVYKDFLASGQTIGSVVLDRKWNILDRQRLFEPVNKFGKELHKLFSNIGADLANPQALKDSGDIEFVFDFDTSDSQGGAE